MHVLTAIELSLDVYNAQLIVHLKKQFVLNVHQTQLAHFSQVPMVQVVYYLQTVETLITKQIKFIFLILQ